MNELPLDTNVHTFKSRLRLVEPRDVDDEATSTPDAAFRAPPNAPRRASDRDASHPFTSFFHRSVFQQTVFQQTVFQDIATEPLEAEYLKQHNKRK